MGLFLVIIGVVGLGLSGVPSLFGDPRSNRGQRLSFFLNVVASVFGLAGVAFQFIGNETTTFTLPWNLPGGSLSVGLDGLSGFFLVPVFFISALGSLYGLDYWEQSKNPGTGKNLRLFYGGLATGMGLLLVSRNSILFLFGWEIMALSAYFLVALEHRDRNARNAAWVYWVATHAGAAVLMVMFILLRNLTGSFDQPFASLDLASTSGRSVLFLLALVGFGLKAGVMPFHFWLPRAHSSAPSHVSGMMSGVMLKMGIYGILRVAGGFTHPPLWWGVLVLALGAFSGVVGILLAIGEGDLKRMLAYSSIENIGIIFMGMGLALVGRSLDNGLWVVLGLSAALFHTLNHSLFKSLLFFSSGSILHAAQTRRMDRLGGLLSVLPVTALVFVLGSCAACALPPLNGFAGEWILYRGLLDFSNHGTFFLSLAAVLSVGGLALIGSLGVVCFVRAFGTIFLGTPRSPIALHEAEAGHSMRGALWVLAATCMGFAFFPQVILPVLERIWAPWAAGCPGPLLGPDAVLPLERLGHINLLLAVVVLALLGWMKTRGQTVWFPATDAPETWGCGYAGPPSARVQYTASSFGEPVVRTYKSVFPLRFRRMTLRGLFPPKTRFGIIESDWILGGLLLPVIRRFETWFARFRGMQQGKTSIYLLYILVVFVLALAWGIGSLP